MDTIASFKINHNTLTPGMYISRVDFGDIVSYDLRFKAPNKGNYLSSEAAHTLEHIFATYVRNSVYKDTIVYAGPMGCLTGLYFLAKGLSYENAITLVQNAIAYIANFEGDIPGAGEKECGNYKLHNLPDAKKEAANMQKVLENWTVQKLEYPN
jgi:S-ribosylhomocysteine lyase